MTQPTGEFLGTVIIQVSIPALEEIVFFTVQTLKARGTITEEFEYQVMTRTGHTFIDSDLFRKGNTNLKWTNGQGALLPHRINNLPQRVLSF